MLKNKPKRAVLVGPLGKFKGAGHRSGHFQTRIFVDFAK